MRNTAVANTRRNESDGGVAVGIGAGIGLAIGVAMHSVAAGLAIGAVTVFASVLATRWFARRNSGIHAD